MDYRRESGYTQTVTSAICEAVVSPAVSDRYLSIEDRVAIADGLVVKDSLRTIAARIGKNVSTVSREVRLLGTCFGKQGSDDRVARV
ncbi:helix-turn-helix domain-containing protein [Dietzia maris]|uniref:helix-turn-helix domain-containing protein n=1 Tax=Dietzia maris TaxID=37915 RepID=UPI0037C638DB